MALTRYPLPRTTVSTWPGSLLTNRLERLFEDAGAPDRDGASRWMPPLDVFESPDDVVITVDLPGLRADDVEVEVEQRTLTLRGSRSREAADVEGSMTPRVWERPFGSFVRSITLPRAVRADDVSARFEHGVLTVTLPKAEEAKPRRIPVESQV